MRQFLHTKGDQKKIIKTYLDQKRREAKREEETTQRELYNKRINGKGKMERWSGWEVTTGRNYWGLEDFDDREVLVGVTTGVGASATDEDTDEAEDACGSCGDGVDVAGLL